MIFMVDPHVKTEAGRPPLAPSDTKSGRIVPHGRHARVDGHPRHLLAFVPAFVPEARLRHDAGMTNQSAGVRMFAATYSAAWAFACGSSTTRVAKFAGETIS